MLVAISFFKYEVEAIIFILDTTASNVAPRSNVFNKWTSSINNKSI